ncbi:MAG: hypothetical protein H7067_19500 [Burkholderiales bacterium]|nr:hypothetical protein [Opitutaceae bacterium]
MTPYLIAFAGLGLGAALAWLALRAREAALRERLLARESDATRPATVARSSS